MSSLKSRVLLSWSSGKDSAWALRVLRSDESVEVAGLLTTFNEEAERVAMHAVRRELVQAQANTLKLPLRPLMLPHPCTNEVYKARMRAAMSEAASAGFTHIAFGDLFLEDVRNYRIRLLEGTGLRPLFPLWGSAEDTPTLAQRMINSGVNAILTCVDPRQLGESFIGRRYDQSLLDELPPEVDSCGERGEFHTFCDQSPDFSLPIPVASGDVIHRDGFVFMDLKLQLHS